jgi:cell division protein FtsZ
MSLASEKTQMETEILDMISGGMTEPRIVIIGCGGAGTKTVGRMGEHFTGVPRIAINTDMTGLRFVEADRKICIGKNIAFKGDSGGFIEVAQKCAELAEDDIRSCLISKDVAFIVAGYGGGTGTGVAPMVAKMAKGLGLVTFGICIIPFSAEGTRRQMAEDHVQELRQFTDSTIVLDNDTLLKFGNDLKLDKAFQIMDKMAVKLIKDVTDSMGRSYLAILAEEALAYQSELGTANLGNQTGIHDADIGVAADSSIAPMAFPQPSDQNLVDMGGMFQRS